MALPDNQHARSPARPTVKLFDVNDGAVLRTFTHVWVLRSMALLPDGLPLRPAAGIRGPTRISEQRPRPRRTH